MTGPRQEAGSRTDMTMMTAAVRAEQIRTLYRQSVGVFLINVINPVMMSALLWERGSEARLLYWTAMLAVVTGIRLEVRRRYWRSPPKIEEAARWGRRFAWGATATGLLWGLGGLQLFDVAGGLGQVLVTFVIGGMTAGAAGTLACYMPAFLGYAIPSLIPVGVRLATLGTPLHLAMAAMIGIYGLALVLIARNTNRTMVEAFRLRFENENLAAKLTAAQQSLENSNRTLEARVAERTIALEKQGDSLRHAQRMESVGMLAGGVAHDFNNLLTVVLANVQWLLKDVPLGPQATTSVEEIGGAANRAADLVTKLLTFSRRQGHAPRVLDLNAVVSGTLGLLKRAMPENVRLVVKQHAEPLPVEADPFQLEQVIINFATNARDAMPNGGTLTLETRTMERGGDDDPSLPGLAPASYVVLMVSDTGVGMDEKTRRRVFDPFFTTKEPGRGTGLGLATVYGIVEQTGGRVSVRSEPGAGSTFSVFLPCARGAGHAVAVAVADLRAIRSGGAQPRNGTVLLADDEPGVRLVTEKALQRAGHTVLSAESGTRALELARTHKGPIDILLTDVVMGEIGGLELAKELAEDRPGLRVLFMSGYDWNAAPPTGESHQGIDFLQKPFEIEVLLAKVAKLLAAAAPVRSN